MKSVVLQKEPQITLTENLKILRSANVNYIFNHKTGDSIVWGKTLKEDPDYSPFGPFIADIEITTICKGINNVPCPFCYKSNTSVGRNMTLGTFKKIFDKLPKSLQQIAFGVDSQCTSNPDTFKIFQYCRDNNVIPNVTVADISEDTAKKLAILCGAVSVSNYPIMYNDSNLCYDSVKRLSDAGLKQVNIHQLVSKQTLPDVFQLLTDTKTDERLKGLNAIVFLSLKQVGRGKGFDLVEQTDYNLIIKYCLENDIKFGFDSCGCFSFLEAVKDHPAFEMFKTVSEPCESTRFSSFINVDGKFSPCSFLDEKMTEKIGLDVLECTDFIDDIWLQEQTINFRETSIRCMKHHKNCPAYNIIK